METTTQQRFKFIVEFDQEPMNDEDAMSHMMQMVRWAGSSVRIQQISNENVCIGRGRFERLRAAALEGIENGIGPAYAEHLQPGDLDPIP